MVIKNSDEIRKEWTPEKLGELVKEDIPSYLTGITDNDIETGKVEHIGRGFAVFKEHINRSGRPPVENKKIVVSIRLPSSDVKKLRGMGKGWQTIVSNFLTRSIHHGDLSKIINC